MSAFDTSEQAMRLRLRALLAGMSRVLLDGTAGILIAARSNPIATWREE